MRYDIRLRIAYDFDFPSAVARHVLRLMPPDLPGWQRLVAGEIRVDPHPDERYDWQDFFGNRALVVRNAGAHPGIAFTLSARVERLPDPGQLDLAPGLDGLLAEVAGISGLGPRSPHHYLGASYRVRPERAITDYARAQTSPGLTVLGMVQAIGEALHRDITFDARSTTVDTAPGEAFERREGVCQDFTHIMIAGLRGLGIPAGYVSGFLRTRPPPGQKRLEGADAMHAWVRAWCGADVGWVEYDPTNACFAAQDHITVAVGRDYADVSPVKGAHRASGSGTTTQAVDVMPLD